MTPIALMRALIRWAEAIRKRTGRLSGRRVERFQTAMRSEWTQRALGKNRATRRKEAKVKVLEARARRDVTP